MADIAVVAGPSPNMAGAAALFGIYADLAYNVYSATNSSPQTTELFASDRAVTLWKYVKLGGWQVGGLTAVGTVLAAPFGLWWAPALGAGSAAMLMYMMYRHALIAGSGQKPPTGEGNQNYFVKTR